MVKKRPRTISRRPLKRTHLLSKSDPKYWRSRLFRNSFTYNGHRFHVNHWSVKIQEQGTRKTFSLRGGSRDQAAIEAFQLYERIVTQGWESLLVPANGKVSESNVSPGLPLVANHRIDAEYWGIRLIHRKST